MVEVIHNGGASRFEAHLDGRMVGHTEYVARGGRLLFVHTETDRALRGAGIAGELVRGALDQVRAAGTPIVPLCPFVASFIERNPEYADLVDGELMALLEEPAATA